MLWEREKGRGREGERERGRKGEREKERGREGEREREREEEKKKKKKPEFGQAPHPSKGKILSHSYIYEIFVYIFSFKNDVCIYIS